MEILNIMYNIDIFIYLRIFFVVLLIAIMYNIVRCFIYATNEKIIFKSKKISVNEYNNYLSKYSKNILRYCIINEVGNEISGILFNKIRCPSLNDTIFLYSHDFDVHIGTVLNNTNNTTTNNTIDMLSNYGSIFLYDYQGYGISTGVPSEKCMNNDLKSVWRFLTEIKKISPQKIVLYGHGLGCSITTYFYSKLLSKLQSSSSQLLSLSSSSSSSSLSSYPKAIILESPPINGQKIKNVIAPNILSIFYFLNFDTDNNLSNINNVPNNKCQIYIFHSVNNESIPYSHSLYLKNKHNIKLIDINGWHKEPIFTDESNKLLNICVSDSI